MAVIPHAIGTAGVDYTPNPDRQIEASSRRPADQAPAGERFRAFLPCDRRHGGAASSACRGFHQSGSVAEFTGSGARVGIRETAK
jgi:hypothetical protein